MMTTTLRSKREWLRGGHTCSRTQFPVVLAYAITIHKSQGISVDRAVLNISDRKDFAPGLTYVAVSRIRTLRGLMFEESFDFSRFKAAQSLTEDQRRDDYIRRQKQEIRLIVGRFEAPIVYMLKGAG